MGTNYYQRTDICKCCNRFKERHIGKSSMGWQFNFQGFDEGYGMPIIRSFEDWKRELKADGKIFDECGQELSFNEFVEFVESKQIEPNNHYDECSKECEKRGYNMDNDWKDDEGYAFTSSEFS